MESSQLVQRNQCEKRVDDGPHCDHQTGSTSSANRVVERQWTCCHCGRTRIEEVPPPEVTKGLSYIAPKHGPFAPQTFTFNTITDVR